MLSKYPRLAVDVVVVFEDGSIVLVKRKNPPFKGCWALPGGFVEYGETVEEAAVREVKEETGLDIKLTKLIGVFSDPNRDPRGHVVSIAYIGKPIGGQLHASSDAENVKLFKEIPKKLAFDHDLIIRRALSLIRVELS